MFNILIITSDLDKVPLREYAEAIGENQLKIFTLFPTDYNDLVNICENTDRDNLNNILNKLSYTLNQVRFDEVFIKEGEFMREVEVFIHSHASYNPVDVTYTGYHLDSKINYAIQGLGGEVKIMTDEFTLSEIPYRVYEYKKIEMSEVDLIEYLNLSLSLPYPLYFIKEVNEGGYNSSAEVVDSESLIEFLKRNSGHIPSDSQYSVNQIVRELSTSSVKNFFTEYKERVNN